MGHLKKLINAREQDVILLNTKGLRDIPAQELGFCRCPITLQEPSLLTIGIKSLALLARKIDLVFFLSFALLR